MKTFYRREMIADAGSFSKSPLKPKVLVYWIEEKFGNIESFEPATRRQIRLAHDPSYVDGVLDCKEVNGFGNCNRDVAYSLPYTVGSMIAATRSVLQQRRGRPVALSPTSGFHHAYYSSGGGYCTFNALIIAAQVAKEELLCDSVYIIDGDQHYGDGTADIIKRLGLTWIKQFTGTRDNSKDYLKQFDKACDEAENYDLVLYQAGADIHVNDPLGGVLTTQDMCDRDDRARCLAMTKPTVWNLAGGYNVDERKETLAEQLEPVVSLHKQTYLRFLRGDGDVYDRDD